jgi:hypothetical protein
MQYLMSRDFERSLRELHSRGGPYATAADKACAIWHKARNGYDEREVFAVAKTHNGESRIKHCVKYDLPGRARLIVGRHEHVCLFLFAGSHDDAEAWLEKNRGLDWVVSEAVGSNKSVAPVFTSGIAGNHARTTPATADLEAPRVLLDMLPRRYADRLLDGLSEDYVRRVRLVGPLSTDDEVSALFGEMPDARGDCLTDVLLALRGGDVSSAKTRLDLYWGSVVPVDKLTVEEAGDLESGEHAVVVKEVDPVLFDYFVKNAAFQDWMLYLHPAQRHIAEREYSGPVRMAGVSGSGKTCVLIHRALRLAEKYPNERVLVLTLTPALAALIKQLVAGARGSALPRNLHVSSFWQLCSELLEEFEPGSRKHYTMTTVTPNVSAISEHIDEIWDEFYLAETNNRDYEVMFGAHRYLLSSEVYPREYLRQEMDYVRSALAPEERQKYLEMDRRGRVVPFDQKLRPTILQGLEAWERKMKAVGAVDEMGIVTALYQHLGKVQPRYRCILADEVQDFGTLELKVVRRLVSPGENDLFLCGDVAQAVQTKHHDCQEAGIDLSGRGLKLLQNYRNSRQILSAAYEVLQAGFDKHSKGAVDLEILAPEHANFSSAPPMLLEAESVKEEIERALGYLEWSKSERGPGRKVCIALCGFTQRSVEKLGLLVGLPVLCGSTDVMKGQVFLSDLEQTKGFEFDSVLILNCVDGVIPHPELPPKESFRELCKLYVAMTRAKTELIISHSGKPSWFLTSAQEGKFTAGLWRDYADVRALSDLNLPLSDIGPRRDRKSWNVPADRFLRYRDAVGLDAVLQDELLDHVPGKNGFRDGKQIRWETVSDFLRGMPNPRVRSGVLTDQAWARLQGVLAIESVPNSEDAAKQRPIGTETTA